MKAVFLTGVPVVLAVVDGRQAAARETEPVVGYDGPESWDDKLAAYYSSAVRTSVEVDLLTMIAHGDMWPITPVR